MGSELVVDCVCGAMAEAAVAAAINAHCGERDVGDFGFEAGAAKVEDNVVTLWIEECYCVWSIQYTVEDGVATEVEGSRSEDDPGMPPCDTSFNLTIPGVASAIGAFQPSPSDAHPAVAAAIKAHCGERDVGSFGFEAGA